MKKVQFIEQAEHSECGLACVAMILNHAGAQVRIQELRDKYGVPRGGYKLTDLKNMMEEFQVTTAAIKVSAEAVGDLKTPFIAFWNQKHYIVVERTKKQKILICDPATGRRWIDQQEFREKFSQIGLIVKGVGETSRFVSERKTNFLISFLLKKFKKPLLLLCGLTMILQLFSLAVPITIQKLIDNTSFLNEFSIGAFTLSVVIVGLSYYALQTFRGLIVAMFQKSFDYELMTHFMGNMLRLPLSFFINRSTGELIFRSNLSVYIKQILTQKVVLLFVDSLFLIFYIGLMFYYSSVLTTISLMIAAVIVFVSVVNTKRIKNFVDLELIEQAKVQKSITEIIEGIETVKTTGTEKNFFDSWKENFQKQIFITQEKERFQSKFGTIPQTLQFLMPLFLLCTGLSLVGQNQVTLGTLVAFISLSGSFLNPVMSLSGVYNDMVILKSYFTKLEEVIHYPVHTSNCKEIEIDSFREISLKGVEYSYSKYDKPVIPQIDLQVKQGEKVAIVGPSGSGKSTVLKLLAGLIHPTKGAVYFNKIKLDDVSENTKNEKIATISQSPMVFNMSVKDNITLNKPFDYENKEDCKKMEGVLEDSDVLSIVRHLPLGIETMVSEQGANLSGGQRQKIALARNLYRDPELHLLDEPTSALDNISERHIMKTLFKKDTTVVVIAHRLQTIKNIDRIIVMNEGEIVGDGSHDYLMKTNVYYRNLYTEEQKMEGVS
ncbi:peptidase domain-containing ABC transporter [Bacillus sp. JZ8]